MNRNDMIIVYLPYVMVVSAIMMIISAVLAFSKNERRKRLGSLIFKVTLVVLLSVLGAFLIQQVY